MKKCGKKKKKKESKEKKKKRTCIDLESKDKICQRCVVKTIRSTDINILLLVSYYVILFNFQSLL